MTLELSSLEGTNPLGFLAALGVVAAVERQAPELGARLLWTESIVPRARLLGPSDETELIELLAQDQQEWADSMILGSGPEGEPVDDLKPSVQGIRTWADHVIEGTTVSNRRDADHFQSLLAEYALALNGAAKPTHLYFTAGRQLFLSMVRELREGVGAGELHEAVFGPWSYEHDLPILRWDHRGERIYALRGTDPANAKNKDKGVPGADWLAFVGLSFFPSAKNGASEREQMLTTGFRGTWKRGAFHWPLWSAPASAPVIRSLLAFDGLLIESPAERRRRGVFRVLEAPVKRAEQGGRGNFLPAGEPEQQLPSKTRSQ